MYVERNRDEEPGLYLVNCDQRSHPRCRIGVLGIKGRASVKLYAVSYCLSLLEEASFKKSSRIILKTFEMII